MLLFLASIGLLAAAFPQLALAWFAAHPFEGLLLAYLALNLVNGALPASAARGPLGRALHALLDRVSMLTRSDAVGTLKWPVIGRSLLGIAVEAVMRPGDAERLAHTAVVDPEDLDLTQARITRIEVPAPIAPAPALRVAPAPHGSRAGEPPRDPSAPSS